MILSNNLENKTSWDTYYRVHLVCVEVKAHNSLEPLVLFALSDADDNTSRPFNRGGIVDLLLLRTQLALWEYIHIKA